MRFVSRRVVLSIFVALSTIAAAPAPARKTPAIASEVLSDRSRTEEDLRILCDEIGGRPTGSKAYEAALQWGVDAFRRARVTVRTIADRRASDEAKEGLTAFLEKRPPAWSAKKTGR